MTLVCLCQSPEELDQEVCDSNVFKRIERAYLPRWKSLINCFFGVFSNLPFQVSYYKSRKAQDIINRLVSDHDYVLCHLIRTADYIPEATKIIKFIDLTDAISLNYERMLKSGSISKFMRNLYKIEQHRVSLYEQKCINEFDGSFVVSDIDKKSLDSTGVIHSNLFVATNGVRLEGFCVEREAAHNILFVGKIDYSPNYDAVVNFIENIFPSVKMKIPSSKFKIVGDVSIHIREKLEVYSDVLVVGRVDDIYESTLDCFVGVCPMRLGAGVQNKLLEYMSFGLPAVTTSIGHEGISAINKKDLLVEDSYEDFSSAIVRIFSNPVLQNNLALNGRRYVENNHAWPVVLDPIVKQISSNDFM